MRELESRLCDAVRDAAETEQKETPDVLERRLGVPRYRSDGGMAPGLGPLRGGSDCCSCHVAWTCQQQFIALCCQSVHWQKGVSWRKLGIVC